MTIEDIGRLAAHLRMRVEAFLARYCTLARNRAQLSLAERPDGACVFLDGSLCAVYEARPQQCREFPERWVVPGCPELEDREREKRLDTELQAARDAPTAPAQGQNRSVGP